MNSKKSKIADLKYQMVEELFRIARYKFFATVVCNRQVMGMIEVVVVSQTGVHLFASELRKGKRWMCNGGRKVIY